MAFDSLLLLENGSNLLQENGGKIVLERSGIEVTQEAIPTAAGAFLVMELPKEKNNKIKISMGEILEKLNS